MKIKLLIMTAAVASSCMADSMLIDSKDIRVIRSEPIYQMIAEKIPYESCYDVKEDASSGGNSVIGTLAGGIIGGVIGNQFGGGSGKTVATVGGAILGAGAGNAVGSTPRQESYKVVRKCDVNYRMEEKRIVTGYTNYAIYNGKEISKESESKLDKINVSVNISY